MADERFKEELLNEEELDNVAGGNIGDRTIASIWIAHYYGTTDGTHGKLIDTSSGDVNAIITDFCAKAGIEHKANEEGLDQFKINGQWRDAVWMAENKQEMLDFFDKQLGIK